MKGIKPIILSAILAAGAIAPTYASVSDLKKQQQQIQQETKEASSALEETRQEKSEAQAEVDAMDVELAKVTDEYNLILEQLEAVSDELNQTELDLARANDEAETQYEVSRGRLRFMYMNGQVGYLDILFSANDFSDFLSRLDYINIIAAYDKNVFQRLKEIEAQIATNLVNIERQKREIEVLKSQQEKKQADLEVMLADKKILLEALDRDERKYVQQVEALKQSDKEIEALIKKKEEEARKAAAAAKNTTSAVYTGGLVGWPLPGYSRLSSDYQYRVNPINRKNEFHTGLDIPAPMGTNIVAAEGGRVIFAGTKSGYGITAIIDHGNGMSTLYAHTSKLLVSEGDTVSRGQSIAKVGSTGQSTGPHLHFEVRIGGAHTNPWKYLK